MSAMLERWAKTCSYSLCRELLRAENTGSRAIITLSWGSGLPTLVLCKQQGISAFLASPPVSDDLIFGKIPIPPFIFGGKEQGHEIFRGRSLCPDFENISKPR